jgi:glycine/D-amino acid oxidase-like deaminating enzyme
LLEAGQLAEGAAGRNSGFMIDLPHELSSEDYSGSGNDREVIALNRRAIAFAKEAVDEYQIRADYFDPAGKVNGAASAQALAHNTSYAAHLSELGEVSELLDAHSMRELTGSRHYVGGLYTPGTVMLQPAGYIRGLGAGLSDTVALFENSPVTSLARTGPDWDIKTTGGKVTAQTVILATNGHLESFGFEKGRLMQLFLYASMSPNLNSEQMQALGGAPRWGITPSDPMGTTVRRIDMAQGGNRIVTRTCVTLRSDLEPKARDLKRTARVHQRKFDDRFPALAGLKAEYVWAGHLCLTKNAVSVMRELEPKLISACVQNGLGTARGTLAGIAAAELAVGVESKARSYFEREAQPAPLPPKPLRDLGANAYLRWREHRAAQD